MEFGVFMTRDPCKDNEAFTPHWEESLSIRVIGDEEKVNEWLRMADY